MIYPKTYKAIQKGTIEVVEIDQHNISELEKFYSCNFDIGSYLILPDERNDTDTMKYRRASIWDKQSFESTFEPS